MSKRYTKQSFAESLDRRLSGFGADPSLVRRVIAAENETAHVKKLSFGVVTAVALLCVLITGALAAAMNVWGIRDFWTGMAGDNETALPENYEEYLQKEDVTIEKDYAVFTVPESYYDGNHACVAVNVRTADRVLLLDYIGSPDGSLYYSGPKNIEVPEDVTMAGYAQEHCGGRAAEVSVSIEADDGLTDSGGGADIYMLNDDGTTTFFLDVELEDEGRKERDVLLHIGYTPATVTEDGGELRFEAGEEKTVTIPLKLRAAAKQQYTCDEELAFPGTGLKITKAVLTVTPLEIHYLFDCVVTDPALCPEYLGFEFVDPEKAGTDPGQKAYPEGVMAFSTSSGSVADRILHFSGSVSREALGDQYAVRAYDMFSKMRYDTVVFSPVYQADGE